MGFSLPGNWTFNQIATTSVGSGSGLIEIDKDIWRSGTDQGVSSVNSPGAGVDVFIDWIRQVYNLALDYGNGNASQRVVEYLRNENYNGYDWDVLIGPIDGDFVDYVNDSGLARMSHFVDPGTREEYDVSHFGASCNAVLIKGFPEGRTGINRGDFGGWAGDWMTFYAEWDRARTETGISGYDFCMGQLAKLGGKSSFTSIDMIADIDAFEIGVALRFGANIADEVERVFGSGGQYARRYQQLYINRFGNDNATCMAAAKEALIGDLDELMYLARENLFYSNVNEHPISLPETELNSFVRGFSALLEMRGDAEPQ
jgi:hypothetical protein